MPADGGSGYASWYHSVLVGGNLVGPFWEISSICMKAVAPSVPLNVSLPHRREGSEVTKDTCKRRNLLPCAGFSSLLSRGGQ